MLEREIENKPVNERAVSVCRTMYNAPANVYLEYIECPLKMMAIRAIEEIYQNKIKIFVN